MKSQRGKPFWMKWNLEIIQIVTQKKTLSLPLPAKDSSTVVWRLGSQHMCTSWQSLKVAISNSNTKRDDWVFVTEKFFFFFFLPRHSRRWLSHNYQDEEHEFDFRERAPMNHENISDQLRKCAAVESLFSFLQLYQCIVPMHQFNISSFAQENR